MGWMEAVGYEQKKVVETELDIESIIGFQVGSWRNAVSQDQLSIR